MLFYIISLCYLLLLSNQNQSSSFPYPNQVYDNKEKTFLSGDLGVLWSEIFVSQDGIFHLSMGCSKIFFSCCQPL